MSDARVNWCDEHSLLFWAEAKKCPKCQAAAVRADASVPSDVETEVGDLMARIGRVVDLEDGAYRAISEILYEAWADARSSAPKESRC